MKKISHYVLASFAVITFPAVAFAQQGTLRGVVETITGLLSTALFLMLAFAVVMFVFYIIKYFIKADANRADAGKYVLYSVLGFFIILSFWGIVNILQGTFGLKNETYQPKSWDSFTRLFPGGTPASNSRFNPAPVSNTGNQGGSFPYGF